MCLCNAFLRKSKRYQLYLIGMEEWDRKIGMNYKLLFVSFTLFLTVSVSAQVLWSDQIPMYGSGDSEGTAYASAKQKLRQEFQRLQNVCQRQGGNFTSRMQNSFCDPYDPSSLFAPQTCLVVGYVTCQAEAVVLTEQVEIKEVSGNQNGAIEPGEKVSVSVTITNSSKMTFNSLKLSTGVKSAEPVLALQQTEMDLVKLVPGESKTLNFDGAILPNAPCGSRVLLSFMLKGPNLLHRFSNTLLIGKLMEKPITLENNSFSQPLAVKGVSYLIGEVTASGKDISQIFLTYTAAVKIPSKYRFWLTTPSGQAIWAYYMDESRTNVTFSRDLTEYVKDGQTNGKWHLSGDMGNGNNAVITSYKLVIVPNSFQCSR